MCCRTDEKGNLLFGALEILQMKQENPENEDYLDMLISPGTAGS